MPADAAPRSDDLVFEGVRLVSLGATVPAFHQQPEVNYLPRFSPLLICLERSPLRGDRSREIDLFENLDMVHIRLLVGLLLL